METQVRPYQNDHDNVLLERIDTNRRAIAMAQRLLYEMEKEAEQRMAERGATSIPSERWVCELVADVSYDRTKFTPLKELLGETDLLACWTPAHQELVTMPESWNTAKVKALARKYGDAALAVVEGAKVVGRPRLKFEKREA
mgnify:CR=1 FL=1